MTALLKSFVTLCCAALISGKVIYRTGKFPYSKCTQTSNDVYCDEYNITKERQETPSLWPPGPYAILMPNSDCPERHSQGWRKGVLKCETSLLGKDLEIQFCVKIRQHPILDKGRWIPGTYTIFKEGETCPTGFSELKQVWKDQRFSGDVSYFGHVPNVTTNDNSGNTSLVFQMCERNSTNSVKESNFGMLQTSFLLGKNKDSDCPKFNNTTVGEVSVLDNAENSYCFYDHMPYEELEDINVAINKPAHMSSMFGLKAIADNAVDGNLSLFHEPHQVCFHTQRTIYNWWYVDLQNMYKIENIKLYNREDGFEYRARQIEILVGNTLNNLFQVGFVESMGLTLTIDMPNNTVGRYVKLFQVVEEYLHFCEIEVYASLVFKIDSFSQLMSDFIMSKGLLPNSEIKENAYTWYQFDLRRTLSVFEIEVQIHAEEKNGNDETTREIFNRDMYISCFYDNVEGSFLHLEAVVCNEKVYLHSNTLRLYLRNVRARFITLLFDEIDGLLQTIKTKESVKIFLSNLPESGHCNEDLGMRDGSIQDLQISASSWLPEHQPWASRLFSDGWCSEPTDPDPWILVCVYFLKAFYDKRPTDEDIRQSLVSAKTVTLGDGYLHLNRVLMKESYNLRTFKVDLLAITVIEGVSIWNDKNARNSTEETKEGRSSFFLFYGTAATDLLMYKDMHFNTDVSKAVMGVQTFMLLNPVETRYVKLEVQGTSMCLRFELKGCKLSGVPTFNCLNGSEMFNIGTSLTTDSDAVIQSDVSTSEDCSNLCLQDKNCSVARYEETCMHYMSSQFALWQISNLTSGTRSAKLCARDPVELFPTLLHTEGELSTNVEFVEQDSVITSIGYPFSFETGQKYTWLIQLTARRYAKLVFTNVSLSHNPEACYDRLLISKDIQTETKGKEIEYQYNKRVFVIETGESLLVLTFFTCLRKERITDRGFRAVIRGTDIPACLSIDSEMVWSEGRRDVCMEPEMILTSMSILNLPFANVDETWEIHASEHRTVQLNILDFYVVCPSVSGRNSSTFAFVDKYEETVFCNTNLPPAVIYAKTSTITVRFRKHADVADIFIRTEGFRLRYSTISHSLERLKDVRNSIIKVCSTTFKKCYRIQPSMKTWSEAAESCLKCNQTLVSIQSKYEMDFINYLLRDMKYRDTYITQEGYSYDSSFVAHIGLRRRKNRLGKKAYIWENTSPITYAAWREGNPTSRKDCTRTNFDIFANKTWESEHCTTDVAQFYVCQSLIGEQEEPEEDERELCSCPRGWIQNDLSCYYFSSDNNDRKNWTDASKACKSLSSYLVEVEDAAENRFIESVIKEKKDSYWMGATDLINEGVFLWNNSGNAVGYTDWLYGEPNNWNGNEDCARYWWEDTYRKWNDKICSYNSSFICEKNAATIEINCEDSFSNSHGYIRVTYAGNECQDWNLLTVAAKDDFRARFPTFDIPVDASNYCQDPTSSGILWCYTKNSRIHLWEPCFIQTLSLGDDLEDVQNTSNNLFECQDGSQIFSLNRCDGIFNCKDFSDEIHCSTKGQYLTDTNRNHLTKQSSERLQAAPYFLCGSNEWISVLATCDDVIDCRDASDELNCSKHSKDSSENGSCDDNSCAQIGSLCDFTPDNTNAAEEFRALRPCDSGEYMCNSRQCITLDKRCNAVADCTDESDEYQCDMCKASFHCDKIRCIPLRLVCDKYPDCEDGTDEISCFPESRLTCDQWWEGGYHDSGEYMIVVCRRPLFKFEFIKSPKGFRVNTYALDNIQDNKNFVNPLTYFIPYLYVRIPAESFLQLLKSNYPAQKVMPSVEGIKAFCDFSSMDTSAGIIAMSIQNVDIQIDEKKGHIYTRSFMGSSQQHTEMDIRNIIYREEYECFLEIKTSCKLYTLASVIEESYNDDSFHGCKCTIDTFKTAKNTDWVWHKVEETEMFNKYKSIQCETQNTDGPDNNTVYYNITNDGNLYFQDEVLRNQLPVEITPGSITCVYEYRSNATRDMIGCEEDDAMIPPPMMCIYDIDNSGFLYGCRSGSHLRNCGNFSCPENTVKCPGSYCIPINFVCDQKVDCPEGHDEYQCTCKDSKKDVLIVAEDTANQTESTVAAIKLAEQFYNTGSHIRLLFFRTLTPLNEYNIEHRLLDIREERIKSDNRISTCRYKSMARNFLGSIKFETKTSKSIVFIEDSLESSKVAELMFLNLSKPNLKIYRVFRDAEFSLKHNQPNTYRFVRDVPLLRWSVLFSIGFKRFPELCEAPIEVPCTGGYRCSSSQQCIPLDQVCDGVAQCIGKDDEQLCDFFCPNNCTCVGYSVNCRAVNLKLSDALALSINTRSANFGENTDMHDALMSNNLHFPYLIRLNLSFCKLESVNEKGFYYLSNLQCLDVGYNKIKILPHNTFSNLKHLDFLNLDGNVDLQVISSTAFHGLKSIKSLRITGTNLKRISMHTFSGLKLHSINISYNEIEEIEDYAFNNTSVDKIDLRGNNIVIFNKRIFDGVVLLREINAPAFKFCCIRPCYVKENACFPKKNEFSSCGDLMRHPILQAVLWLIGIAAVFGNFGSIIYRLVYDRTRLRIGYGIFVTNLAAADFLMGVYLIMIAVVDSYYRDRYIFMDDQWRNSAWCVAAGVMSTVSSEASVLFLCLITLDRLLVIKYPFGTVRFGPKRAYIFCFVSWVISFMLALIPLVYTSYFQGRFYSRSGVCIALPLTRDKPPGWMYSVFIFVGLNFCTFMLVAIGQISIFMEIRKARLLKTRQSRKRDLQVARNLILVATTDFMCWFPVGLMGIMALNDYPIPGDVYAWTAVFILPLNSALNPILYTLSAIIGRQSFNPSTEEQTRTEMLQETGSVVVQYHELTRSVRMKGGVARSGKRILHLKEDDECLSALNVMAIGLHLSKFLSLLHESSVSIDRLSIHNTYVKLNKQSQRVSIVIDSKMAVASDGTELQDNMYQFGKLLQRLVSLIRQKQL